MRIYSDLRFDQFEHTSYLEVMNKFDVTEFAKIKHGRITLLKELDPICRARMFLCQCDCGKVWPVALRYIKSGMTKSCGCLKAELRKLPRSHGMSGRFNKSTEYKIWASMIQRCTNAKEWAFQYYGGRGITVCDRWRKFENFYADMGPRPSKELSLDRIDPNGNYEKSNCRWATKSEQSYNRRVAKLYDINGRKLNIQEVSELTGLNKSTLKYRLNRSGWPLEKALTHPLFPR